MARHEVCGCRLYTADCCDRPIPACEAVIKHEGPQDEWWSAVCRGGHGCAAGEPDSAFCGACAHDDDGLDPMTCCSEVCHLCAGDHRHEDCGTVVTA
jgi:hypothetical protein